MSRAKIQIGLTALLALAACAPYDRSAAYGPRRPEHLAPELKFDGFHRRVLSTEGWTYREARWTLINRDRYPLWLPAALWQSHDTPQGAPRTGTADQSQRALAPGHTLHITRWVHDGQKPLLRIGYAHHRRDALRYVESPTLQP